MSETLLYECGTPLLYEANATSGSTGKPILGKLHAPFFDLNNTTRNGRDYSKVAKEALESPEFQEKIATRTFFGRLGHPMTDDEAIEDPAVRACVILTDVSMNKKTNMYEGTLEIINNVYGQQLKSLIDAGCIMGVSTRGTGEVKRTGDRTSVVLPGTYEFEALDVVTLPAVKSARCVVLESKGKIRENILTEAKVLDLIEDTDYTEVQVFESLKTSVESSDLVHKDILIEGINRKLEEKDNYVFGTVKGMIIEAEESDEDIKAYQNFIAKLDAQEADVEKKVVQVVQADLEKAKQAEQQEKVEAEAKAEEEKKEEAAQEQSTEEKTDTDTETDKEESVEAQPEAEQKEEVKEEPLTAEDIKEIQEVTGMSEEEVKQEAQEVVKEEEGKQNVNESETIVSSLVDTISELSERLAEAENSLKSLQAQRLQEAEEEETPEESETVEEEEVEEAPVEEEQSVEEKDDMDASKELIPVFIKSINDYKNQVRELQTQIGELGEENSDLATENEEKVEECITLRKALRKNNEVVESLKKEYEAKYNDTIKQYNLLKESYETLQAENANMKNVVIESVAKANRISVSDLKAKVSINESLDKISTTAKSIRESMDRQHILGISSLSNIGRPLSRDEYEKTYGGKNDSQDEGSSRFAKTFNEILNKQ